ncbi:MAG: hypothetical protein H7Z40_12250 [Phycisphaerae bacterium]|nr:hypothetical protein [Gemmatimonadaceae bacterium]
MLHARATSAPPIRLVLDLVLGGLATVVAVWFRPVGWVQLASAGLCFAMYGAWAFAERHLDSSTDESSRLEILAWGVLRGLYACVGLLAAVTLAASVAGLMLGTQIS